MLRARDATRATAELAIERGAHFVTGTAAPEDDAVLVGGDRLEGDRVVWAGVRGSPGSSRGSSTSA